MSEREGELVALLNLLAIDGIGSATAQRLVSQFGSARAAFGAPESALRGIPRISDNTISRLHSAKADADFGKRQIAECAAKEITILTAWDEEYPPLLKAIETDAPVTLFVRGKLMKQAKRVAIVGTRSATEYGRRMTGDIVRGLQNSGVHVVSGLASGVDGFAHEAAVAAGVVTEAVFGCGVDIIYPPNHGELAQRIVEAGGALLSEYPLGTQPDRTTFPQRNRIIAGLSHATLVVEAGDKSGALITSSLAMEYNREVMAIPGAVNNPKCRGCHRLIRDGAALIEKAEDILELLQPRGRAHAVAVQQPLFVDLAPAEKAIYEALDVTESIHIDVLSQKAGVPVGDALGKLLMLELKGVVRQLPGKYFVRA